MATSKLQKLFGDMLDQRLPEYRIRENYRPDWLISSDNTWLELDFYIEEIKIAFEVQGAQHFQFVPFFHKSEDDFKKRQKHDREKQTLCYGKGIRLIEICTETDAEIAIKNIEEKIKREQPKYFYGIEELEQKSLQPSYELIKAIKLARKAIKMDNGRKDGTLHIAKRVASVFRMSKREKTPISDIEILSFYENNKNEVDTRL